MLRGHSEDSIRLGHITRAASPYDFSSDTETERRELLKVSLAEDRHPVIGLEKKRADF
jgi:hypothetical protein